MRSHLVRGRGRFVSITNHTKPSVCAHIWLRVGVRLSVLQIILKKAFSMHSHLVRGRGRLVSITNHTKPSVCTHIWLRVGVGLSVLQIILSLQYALTFG